MKEFIKAMLIRAAHTFAQTALGLLIVGQTITEVDWINVLSVSAVATIISMLKSVAVGLPEVTGVDPDE
jgi:hypothetical protein